MGCIMIKKQIFFYSLLYFLSFNIISFAMESNNAKFIQTLDSKVTSLDLRVLTLEQQNAHSSSTRSQENNTNPTAATTNNNNQTDDPWLTPKVVTALINSVPKVKTISDRIERLQLQEQSNEPVSPHLGYDYVRLLFTGRTGTGKTTLAHAIAKKLNRTAKLLSPASEGTEYQFCLQKYIKKEMEEVFKATDQFVVIIDEIDQLNKHHHDTLHPALALSHYMDEAEEQDRNRLVPRIIFIATTNNPGNIQEALRSRLRKIEIECPNEDLRNQILTTLINQSSLNKADCQTSSFILKLSRDTKDFSIRNLNELCKTAEEIAFLQSKNKGGVIALSKTHMLEAYKMVWPKTIAAEKYWPNRAYSCTHNLLQNYGPQLLLSGLVPVASYYVVRYISKKDRIQEEKRYQDQRALEEERHQEYLKQRSFDEKRYQEQQTLEEKRHQEYLKQRAIDEKRYQDQQSLWHTTRTAAINALVSVSADRLLRASADKVHSKK